MNGAWLVPQAGLGPHPPSPPDPSVKSSTCSTCSSQTQWEEAQHPGWLSAITGTGHSARFLLVVPLGSIITVLAQVLDSQANKSYGAGAPAAQWLIPVAAAKYLGDHYCAGASAAPWFFPAAVAKHLGKSCSTGAWATPQVLGCCCGNKPWATWAPAPWVLPRCLSVSKERFFITARVGTAVWSPDLAL